MGGNHLEKLGLERISCAGQFTIPDMAGTSPDREGNHTDTSCSKPNEASCTADLSYLLISSISFPSSSPICHSRLQLYHPRENTKFSHPPLSLNAMIMS